MQVGKSQCFLECIISYFSDIPQSLAQYPKTFCLHQLCFPMSVDAIRRLLHYIIKMKRHACVRDGTLIHFCWWLVFGSWNYHINEPNVWPCFDWLVTQPFLHFVISCPLNHQSKQPLFACRTITIFSWAWELSHRRRPRRPCGVGWRSVACCSCERALVTQLTATDMGSISRTNIHKQIRRGYGDQIFQYNYFIHRKSRHRWWARASSEIWGFLEWRYLQMDGL